MHPRALLLTAAAATALAVGGCSSSDARSEAPAPAAAGSTASGPTLPPAAVGAGLEVSATEACELVSAEDVAAAFGGEAADATADGGACGFSLSGDTVIGELSGASVQVHVLLAPEGYVGIDEQPARALELEPVAGLGDQAWYTPLNRELHIDVGGTDLVVIGAPGDAEAGRDAVLALGRAILVRLEASAAPG